MNVKKKLFPKGFCAGLMAATFFVGVHGCETKSPTVAPVNPPPQQQPLLESAVKTPAPIMTPYQPKGEIRGRKFIDQDGNRQYGGSDTPETGWEIRLYPSSNISNWSSPMIASTTTDSTGSFSFSGLENGQYLVVPSVAGKSGERMQQLAPLDTAQAKGVTLPQQANATCQSLAYQVTVNSGQPCDLAFMDQASALGGTYPGAYGGYGAYPGGYGYPGAYGEYGPYGGYGCYPGLYGAYGVYPLLAEIPVVIVYADDDDHDCRPNHRPRR